MCIRDRKIDYQHLSIGLPHSDTILLIDDTIQFYWTGKEYELILETDISVDSSFSDPSKSTLSDMSLLTDHTEKRWNSSTKNNNKINYLIEKIARSYISEALFCETQKSGFLPIEHQKNKDGSNTILFERWNI